MRKRSEKCSLLIPCDARQLTRFLAGLIAIMETSYQEGVLEKRIVAFSINQNTINDQATVHFSYKKSGIKKYFKSHYIPDRRFSFDDSDRIVFDCSEVQDFTPQWVDAYNSEQVIITTFLELCPSAKVLTSSHFTDAKGKLFCSFSFQIEG